MSTEDWTLEYCVEVERPWFKPGVTSGWIVITEADGKQVPWRRVTALADDDGDVVFVSEPLEPS